MKQLHSSEMQPVQLEVEVVEVVGVADEDEDEDEDETSMKVVVEQKQVVERTILASRTQRVRLTTAHVEGTADLRMMINLINLKTSFHVLERFLKCRSIYGGPQQVKKRPGISTTRLVM